MANIMEVNYQEIPGKANQIQQLGEGLYSELKSVWTRVDELRSTWHGTRYNILISYFNNATESINEIVRMVIDEIPTALGTVATNYAKADGQSVPAVAPGSVTPLERLADTDTSTMAYQSAPAETVLAVVASNFSGAEKYMDDIEATFKSITWESDAKDVFQDRFTTLKKKIVEDLKTIDDQFQKMMKISQSDIESAEHKNTVE